MRVLPALAPRRSALRDHPDAWTELTRSIRPYVSGLGARERAALEETVRADLVSEYDARHLFEHLLEHDLSPAFRAALAAWRADEELHCRGFAHVVATLHGRAPEDVLDELRERAAAVDFAPLAELFEDELAIACLFAYDEIATVRAYRRNLPRYRWLGPGLVAFARQVTADEGAHCGNFLAVLYEEHAARLDEVDAVVERIRRAEGLEYRNTFVLDHDDDVWNDGIFDDAARLVRRLVARR